MGEQHLLDQITNMVGFVCAGSPATRIEPIGKIHLHHRHTPVTLVWVTDASNGVPEGAQIA
jgi:hypothetical protein